MTRTLYRTAEIRAVAARDPERAETMLTDFLAGLFDLSVRHLRINRDQYSLNSLNGFFDADEQAFFFKFHQEEGEEDMAGEYYRVDILSRAGLPVDQPVHASTLPGEQVLVYRRRDTPRFSDVLFALDRQPDAEAEARALAAEADLNDRILAVAKKTLHPITPDQSAAEPIHRLFHARMQDADGTYPGGRLAAFYAGQSFDLPGVTLGWEQIATAIPVINGRRYARSLGVMFDLARERYAPRRLADAGGITAHGDAHNANVWYERGPEIDRLSFFDPAFAGSDVPALVAEVKSTFHNTLAHPFWLYDNHLLAGRYDACARLTEGCLHIDTNWEPSALRRGLLAVKADHFWRPWLAHLAQCGMLPDDWEDVIRIGLFLSPTLVMNLRAGAGRHDPLSSAIGLSVALMCGSAPVDGDDLLTEFFDRIRP